MSDLSDRPNGEANFQGLPLDRRSLPPMGMTGKQFHEAGLSVLNDIERYYDALPSRPVLPSVSPGYLQKLLPTVPPEDGEAWQDIEKDIERTIMPGITHWQHPHFMAFYPASSTYPGILGDMWSAALTAPAFNWICSPAVTELETIVLDWLAQILGLPDNFLSRGNGGGVIQGSASEAVVTVMVAARERFIRRQIKREGLQDLEEIEDRSGEIRAKLVALASDQAHSSSEKAATIAGTRFRSIITRHEDSYALKGDELRKKIEQLRAKGLHPYYLTVTLGTTGCCAVDDFASIAEVVKDYPDIWIHCDAAYAGSALVLPKYHHLSKQMAFVDSFNMNVHKWLLTNFDSSCLYLQHRRDLIDALQIHPPYVKNQYTDSGFVTDYRDWQISFGRRFRALKMWFVIRTWGVRGLQDHIRHHLALGDLFTDLVKSRGDLFRILVPPAFALLVLTINPHVLKSVTTAQNVGADGQPSSEESNGTSGSGLEVAHLASANDVTKQVLGLIDQRKEFFLTSTVIDGVYAIRVVSCNPLAEEKYIRKVFEVLVSAAEEVLALQTK